MVCFSGDGGSGTMSPGSPISGGFKGSGPNGGAGGNGGWAAGQLLLMAVCSCFETSLTPFFAFSARCFNEGGGGGYGGQLRSFSALVSDGIQLTWARSSAVLC